MSEATTNETSTSGAGSAAADTGGGSPKKRPTFLTVLCILTFIGSGLGVLFSLLTIVGAGFLGSLADSIPGAGALAGAGMGYSITATILAAASLFGAIQMWKLKKTGFYIYTAASILALISPFIFLDGYAFSVMGAIFPVLFIVLYALNLKHME